MADVVHLGLEGGAGATRNGRYLNRDVNELLDWSVIGSEGPLAVENWKLARVIVGAAMLGV